MMSRNCFDDLWRYIRFSDQPLVCPSDMTADQYCWKPINDFVKMSMIIVHQHLHRRRKFVSMNPYLGGTEREAIG
jgi:hypothetical protein